MSKQYRAALVGCSRMGAFIDNEVVGTPHHVPPYSHAAGYEACDRTDLVAGTDLRPDVLEVFGERYGVGKDHLYTDYKELIAKEQPDILSIATQPEHRADIAIYAAEHGVKALYCEKALCASLPEARRDGGGDGAQRGSAQYGHQPALAPRLRRDARGDRPPESWAPSRRSSSTATAASSTPPATRLT